MRIVFRLAIIVLVLSGIFGLTWHFINHYENRKYDIRGDCLEKWSANISFETEKECFDAICGSIGMRWSSSSSFYEPTINCINDAGVMQRDVDYSYSTLPECRAVLDNLWATRYCIDSQGAGYY